MRTKKSKLRAGKTTCRRCKTVFWRAKGERHRICEWCRAHCARCDRQLPIEAIKPECITCQAETTHNIAAGKRAKDTALLRAYGITVNEYETILEAQQGRCWICNRPPGKRSLNVDHRHLRGENRRNPREKRSRVTGILCWNCNRAIAKFRDSPALLRRAAEYLECSPAQVILAPVIL